MSISRRMLVHGLGAGVLGAGALTACGEGGIRRGRRRPTTTAPTAEELSEPDSPLVIGAIGASHGRTAPFDHAVGIGIDEALIDVNAQYKGLFEHEVQFAGRHVLAEAGEDLTEAIEEFAEAGVSVVITSVDEETLIDAIPAFVEAGMAVIDTTTSAMALRESEVASSGMLLRLTPNNRAIAAVYAEEAWSASGSHGGAPGTVAVLSEDSMQGRDLRDELTQILAPEGGELVLESFYGSDGIDDQKGLIEDLVETPPALLVINGGPEAGPFLSALHEATLDEGQRPTVEIPVRLAPAATVDYSGEDLAPECLSRAIGFEPGGEIHDEHRNMMLNVDPELQSTGYAYSQQAYDAVILACLAAQDALSVEGTDIAASIPRVLSGDEQCSDLGDCRSIMREALNAGGRATVAFEGRMGPLEFGSDGDPSSGALRTYSWSDAGALEEGTIDGFEVEE